MRSARHLLSATCLFLSATLLVSITATTARAADDDDDADEYDVTARVVRVSLLRGDVQLRRAGNKNWERAELNFPLVEGDTLTTGGDARLEIQIDARNFVRVGADSLLQIITLRDEGVALSLAEGTATVRLARFDRDREYFEVDAPKTTVAAEKSGLYRLDVARGGNVRVTVRGDGRARIYSETSGFTLRDGRTAELVPFGSESDWELSSAPPLDDWDRWTDEREQYLAERLRHDGRDRYYDREVWGAEELDAFGDWSYADDYGWVWRPHVTVINNYHNWAPYRHGRWTWCPPYGWTWVGNEPWGWAPYHYGRWVYHNNSWGWAPRGHGYKYKRSWWRPALVAFVYVPTSHGEHVAWYPLTYGQRDPHSRRYRQSLPDRLTPSGAGEIARRQRTVPAHLRAVTTLPARDFGRRAGRTPRPAEAEFARRAITNEPVRGRLPITPADADSNNSEGAERRTGVAERARTARSSETSSTPTLPERPTGAARRRPGVPLDEELRRARIFSGREPRVIRNRSEVSGNSTGNDGGSSAGADAGNNTGAVMRPARPTIRRPPIRRDAEADADSSDSGDSSDNGRRRARRERRNPQSGNEPSPPPGVNDSPEPEERRQPAAPVSRPSRPQDDPPRVRPDRPERIRGTEERPDRPGRTERREMPAERERRPERDERPERRPGPERIERYEAPAPRPDPPPAPVKQEEQQSPPREQPDPSRPDPPPPPKQEERPPESPREREETERPERVPRKVDPGNPLPH